MWENEVKDLAAVEVLREQIIEACSEDGIQEVWIQKRVQGLQNEFEDLLLDIEEDLACAIV